MLGHVRTCVGPFTQDILCRPDMTYAASLAPFLSFSHIDFQAVVDALFDTCPMFFDLSVSHVKKKDIRKQYLW